MTLALLHGGGDDPAARRAALGPLIAALPAGPAARLALLICEPEAAAQAESAAAYAAIFRSLAEAEVVPVIVTPAAPLSAARLRAARPDGVFICGGATPRYHEALCADAGWLAWAREAGLPIGGTSAGAAVLAERALVGGWRAERAGALRQVLFQGAGEGLDRVEVRPGLGLAPGAVDVHASQWGTLLRLVHAVDLGLAPHGWAIDENTALLLGAGEPRAVGAGQVYRVERAPGGVAVRVLAGA